MKIKTHFNGWKEVSKDRALEYAKYLYVNITSRERIEIINTRLEGVKINEEELRGY